MCKTNTHCNCAHAEPSIITLPLNVAGTLCVSEKLICCLVGESQGKTIFLHAVFLQTQQSIFSASGSRAVSHKLDLLADFKGRGFLPPPLWLLWSARAYLWVAAARTRAGNYTSGRLGDTSGRQGGGWGARQSWAGGEGERMRRRGEDRSVCICMKHPALPSSQAAAVWEAEEEGGEGKD